MSHDAESAHPGAVDPDQPISQKPPGAPEFSLRAILVGFLVAAIVAASYPYMVLKLGFGPNISVVSAFLGYIILGLAFRFLAKNFNRWENNIIQTAGTAGGQTAFLCVIMAAFDMLRMDPALGFTFELQPWQTFLWLSTAGTLGALLAVPMRQHFIVDEKLRYPDGVAVAETLVILDSKARSAFRAAMTLMSGFAVSAVTAALVHFQKLPGALHFWPAMEKYRVGLDYSFLSYGSGMLVGMRINFSMMAGSILSWVIAPVLLLHYGILSAEHTRNQVLFWVMWPATGMLVAGGFAALIFRWSVMAKTFKQLASANVSTGDFPMRQLVIGVVASAVALVLVQKFALGMPMWMTVVAILFTVPLMLVGLRVLGETNWGPISALSNLMQGIFGLLAPGNIQANMVASGVTGSVAIESEALMQDFKTAHLIGATPKYLTYMQLMAVPVGALVLALVYPMVRDAYGLAGEKNVVQERTERAAGGVVHPNEPTIFILPAGVDYTNAVKPGDQLTIIRDKDNFTQVKVAAVQDGRLVLESAVPPNVAQGEVRWKIVRDAPDSLSSPISTKWAGFARILGGRELPPYALFALLVGVILGIAFTALEQNRRIKPFAPSPTGIGIGMLVPMGPIFAMFLGGVTEWVWRKINKPHAAQYVIPLASGMIAGDALTYTILAILIFAGVGWAMP